MSRLQLVLIWLLCVLAAPVLLAAMLAEALVGSTARAKNIAIAQDEAGNSLFGGAPTQTISERTGNALIEGEQWAHFVAPCIDLLFGKGHCLANATISPK
ncbi:hypothetical protein NUJ30_08495 [Burkholderia contaminans]|uniref:hypothetical protein n=1 Tax=Burkholderia TaxID=32008 RepID=UPI0010F9D85B|nr:MULTISPECIES: hypothetical protein [Burkholderia]MBD1412846.1 hypothetical protein [Burkholderia contaminans]UXZ68703.1 hypothetical protein NUJ29_08500 [Burkholderia contaminans]UXZ76464.1 hypothetical protein NUJ30_08495 [Burkholderia contaminans]